LIRLREARTDWSSSRPQFLLDRNGLGQVARLVDVQAAEARNAVGEKL
jgi:hypothetical protein